MKNIFLKLFISTAIISFVLIGCQKEDGLLNNPNDNQLSEIYVAKNKIAKEVAKNLALKMSSKNLREFIKKEAMKTFDGDYNFLVGTSKEKKIQLYKSSENATFGNIISNSYSKAKSAKNTLLDSIESLFPLLQVAVTELEEGTVDSWDIDNHVPLVAYVPFGRKDDIIPAFDSEGNLIELSATEPPDELVIVISENERLIGIKKGNFKSITPCINELAVEYSTPESNYYLKEDYYDARNKCIFDDGGSTGGSGGGAVTCDRDRKTQKDNLYRMKFNSMADYRNAKDGWFNNDLEIELHIFLGRKDKTFSELIKYKTGKQNEFKDCGVFSGCETVWFNFNTEIVTWDKSLYGDAMLYAWYEDDGGGTTEMSVSFSTKFEDVSVGITGKYTIPKENDKLGQSIVEYCDNTDGNGYTYDTGSIKFQVRQK